MRFATPSLLHRAAASVFAITLIALLAALANAQQTDNSKAADIDGWPGHARDAQHTALSTVAAQPLKHIHWHAPVDLNPPAGTIFIHYGSPVVTPKGTVIFPVKTDVNTFRIEARDQETGALIWRAKSGWQAPFAFFIPGMGPVLSHGKLYIPDAGGTVLVREKPDKPNGPVSRLVFYGADNFNSNPSLYSNAVMISTPITADSEGNIYFGFFVNPLPPTPIGLESGLARISADGEASFVIASFAANDSQISKFDMSCAPALSLDEKILYVGVNSSDFGFGYLLALDSQTLKTIAAVRLFDPSTGFDADISDESSASPAVGPDGDVYFGVLEDPFPFQHNDRGWLLHFNRDLSQQKIPGSFGWDDTPSIVPASMVPSYQGTSSYLLMSKYNNYANIGTGDGVNKIAILDPNATEPDPIIPSVSVMNEVLTIKGATPDPDFIASFPHAVREWCINTAAVDPATKSVLANSEDGKLYRWDLTTNHFSQVIKLSNPTGEAYTPTLIGTDGTAFAINDAILFAIGK